MSRRISTLSALFVAGVLPAILALSARRFTTIEYASESLHAFAEVTGGCIAIAVGLLLTGRVRWRDSPHLIWPVGALIAMGILDMAHGAWEYGVAWAWLRLSATTVGGALFGLVALPASAGPVNRRRVFVSTVGVSSVAIVLLLAVFHANLSPFWNSQDGYALWAVVLNAIGGIGFAIASLSFFRRFLSTGGREDLTFACLTLFFAVATSQIWLARSWHLEWWLWHFFRLTAYGIIVVAAYDLVTGMQKQVLQANLDLERLVSARTAELQSSREQIRTIVDTIPSLISIVDADFRYCIANKAYETWFKKPLSEVLGRHAKEVLGATIFERIEPRLLQAFSGECATFDDNAVYPSGERWVNATYMPHRDAKGDVRGAVVLVADITERKRAEKQLAEAQVRLQQHAAELERTVAERTERLRDTVEELEAFSYSIAHDMRAPLRAMHSFAKILVDEHRSNLSDEGKDFLERIYRAAQRLDGLINDVLTYSQVSRQQPSLHRVNPEALIREIVSTYPNLSKSNVHLQLQPGMPDVIGNSAALTQVISNLLGNAIKFVKPGRDPSIRIRAETVSSNGNSSPLAGSERVLLWFEDDGIGIDPAAKDNLFAMFQRIHSTDNYYEGAGIGLAIVRKAVERMGGRVGVESELGKGARFWVELRKAGALPEAAEPWPDQKSSG